MLVVKTSKVRSNKKLTTLCVLRKILLNSRSIVPLLNFAIYLKKPFQVTDGVINVMDWQHHSNVIGAYILVANPEGIEVHIDAKQLSNNQEFVIGDVGDVFIGF